MFSPKLEKQVLPLVEEGKVVNIKLFLSNEGGQTPFAAHAHIGDYSVVGFGPTPKIALSIMTERLLNDMPS